MLISGYKKFLFSVMLIAAAVLCALPFLADSADDVYIYTAEPTPNATEQDFIAALKGQGVSVKINTPHPKQTAIWFRSPEQVADVIKNPVKYNFMYSEVHNVVDWRGMKNPPIVLTPHRDIFEHYTRSNLKTALFDLQNNTKAARRFLEILNWLKANSSN